MSHFLTLSSDTSPQKLDQTLKTVCEDLITSATTASTVPLTSFLALASKYIASRGPSGTPNGSTSDLATQPFAIPQAVLAVHEATKKTIEKEVKAWIAKLRVYLEDDEAVEVLIPPMQVSAGSIIFFSLFLFSLYVLYAGCYCITSVH